MWGWGERADPKGAPRRLQSQALECGPLVISSATAQETHPQHNPGLIPRITRVFLFLEVVQSNASKYEPGGPWGMLVHPSNSYVGVLTATASGYDLIGEWKDNYHSQDN